MGSSGETNNNSIDASVGTLVWVRRRNGSWWPGRIMGTDELPEGSSVSPNAGTPVKLLGRDDASASVDWYNLERSKRVKAFRCGDYDACIEKAKALAASGNKKKVKYARREDAIIHALEIEKASLGKEELKSGAGTSNSAGEHGCSASESPDTSHSGEENEDMVDDVSDSEDNSDSVPELSQSGISFEEPNHISSSKLQPVQARRRKTPNDSEDDGTEGVLRMRGLEDLGMGIASKRSVQTGGLLELVQQDSASLLDSNTRNGTPNGSPANGSKGSSSLKRKRSQVANANESSKRKSRSRTLTKVLESTALMSIPVMSDQLPNSFGSPHQGLSDAKVSGLESDESKGRLSADHNGTSCENGASLNGPEQAVAASCINDEMKENGIPSISGLAENDFSDRVFTVASVGMEKDPSGCYPILRACSTAKPQTGGLGRQSSKSIQAEVVSLRNERTNESSSTSSGALLDIAQSIENGTSKWKLKGKRNARKISKDRKRDLRRYMDVNESDAYSAGIEHSDGLFQDSDLKLNCNGISGSGAYNCRLRENSKQVTILPDGTTQRSLPYRQSRLTLPARYQSSDSARNFCSDGCLYDVKLEVKANYRPQHVPLVSLMSKLNGKAIVGHPLTIEALGDGACDILLRRLERDKMGHAVKPKAEVVRIPVKALASQPQTSPCRSPKTKKSGLQSKKTRKLSSLTGHKQSDERHALVPKPTGPVVACIPLKVVFSRINEALNGSARPTHRVQESTET